MPRKWSGNGGEEDRNCEGDCIKSDLERVGEECKTGIDRWNWRLLTENVEREKLEEEKYNGKGNHGQLTPDNSDAKKIITKKCNLTLV